MTMTRWGKRDILFFSPIQCLPAMWSYTMDMENRFNYWLAICTAVVTFSAWLARLVIRFDAPL